MAGRIRSIASAVHNRRALLPPLVVVGGLLLLLWPVLFGDQTLFYRDLYRQHMGTARLLHDGLPNGLLWDPLLNGGQPLLGNPNRFVLYPTRLLYIILQPLTGLNWEIALHLLLGGLGTVFLARRLGLAGTGSAVAGAAYALGGFSISLTNHLGRLFAYHWLPWIVLAVVAGSARSPTARWWRAAVPVLLAVQWLTGAAELSLMAAALVVAWTSFSAGQSGNHLRALWRASLWVRSWSTSVFPTSSAFTSEPRCFYLRSLVGWPPGRTDRGGPCGGCSVAWPQAACSSRSAETCRF
ncbi:MAG: hypothetical protein P8Y93_14810 [Acidobacteriota bacterium]